MFRRLSLKARLGLGAGLLGLATLLTAAMLVAGMARVSQRIDTALVAEQRLEHYAALSTQVSTFIVVAAEVIQRGLPPETIRRLLEGSEIGPSHAGCDRVQDPYSVRCVPQVHGASRDALAYAAATVERDDVADMRGHRLADRKRERDGGDPHELGEKEGVPRNRLTQYGRRRAEGDLRGGDDPNAQLPRRDFP